MPQGRADIAATPKHVEYEHMLTLDSVKNDVFADGKASQASAQVFIPAAT